MKSVHPISYAWYGQSAWYLPSWWGWDSILWGRHNWRRDARRRGWHIAKVFSAVFSPISCHNLKRRDTWIYWIIKMMDCWTRWEMKCYRACFLKEILCKIRWTCLFSCLTCKSWLILPNFTKAPWNIFYYLSKRKIVNFADYLSSKISPYTLESSLAFFLYMRPIFQELLKLSGRFKIIFAIQEKVRNYLSFASNFTGFFRPSFISSLNYQKQPSSTELN